MRESILFILPIALLCGVLLGGVSSADDSPTEEAVFFVQ